MNEQDKIYWHDAHHEALKLELYEYEDALEFLKEYQLSKEALRMDTLVIKKVKDVKIEKNIGRMFRNHNIVEYKSEKDSFSLWDYQKILGYAYIYSGTEKVQISDITISVSLTVFPREFIKNLETERGFEVKEFDNGILYITGDVVPIQILESKNLSEDENLFLRNLRSNLSGYDMEKTLKSYKERRPLNNNKDVFLDRLVKANPIAFEEAMMMFSDEVKEIFLESAERNGWFNDRDTKKIMGIAKKLLLLGDSVEKVTEATELPLDTVISIANEIESAPAGV